MVAKTFQTQLVRAIRSGVVISKGKESLDYLSSAAKTLRNVTSASIIREAEKSELVNINQLSIGKMYFFYYDAKWKDTLPYWDRFPCIFPLSRTNQYLLGLNLHYLPYDYRVELMDVLYDIENNAKSPENKRLQLSYGVLKATTQMKAYKPCIKKYLHSHVKSRFFKIPYEAWNVGAFLPVASWEKASESEVWAATRKMLD